MENFYAGLGGSSGSVTQIPYAEMPQNLCFSRVKAEKEAKAVSLQQAIRDKPPVLPESNLILKMVQKSLAVQVQLALIFLTKKVIQSKK